MAEKVIQVLDITKRFKKFPTLISTEAVGELKSIESTKDEWRIGGAVTLTEIKNKLGQEFPALNNECATHLRRSSNPGSRGSEIPGASTARLPSGGRP